MIDGHISDVGIDLDSVLFDFCSTVVDHFSRELGWAVPRPRIWEFYSEWGLSKEEFYGMLEEAIVEHDFFNCGSPIPGTLEGWKLLRQQNVKIHIITHRSLLAMRQTAQWLERYNLIPDGLHFTENKASVLDAVSSRLSVALDDNYDHVRNYKLSGIPAFYFTQPWNENLPGRRVGSLTEFATYVKVCNEYQYLEDYYEEMEEEF